MAELAERTERAHDQRDDAPRELRPALASLVLSERLRRRPPGERWTACAGGGRLLDVWRLAPWDPDVRRRLTEAASRLPGVRHPNLVPVLAAGERDGDIWIASELETGCSLRRLLAVATLTPEQASLIIVAVIAGLDALHRAGLAHACLDDRIVHVGETGRVRLGDWGLGVDWYDFEGPLLTDSQAAVILFGRLRRTIRRTGGRRLDAVATLLRTLDACCRATDDEAALLERVGEAAAAILFGRAGERAAAELAAIVGRLEHEGTDPEGDAPGAAVVSRPRAHGSTRAARAAWTPAPRRTRWVAAGLALLLVACATGALALVARRGHLPPAVHLPPAASLPHLGAQAGSPAATRLRAPSPSPTPMSPRPVPVLAPSAAGPITGIEIQTLGGACRPNAACPVQVTVRLQPQQAAQEVRWSFHVFDRCTGKTAVLPGVSTTALAGWPYVFGTSRPALSGSHPLALIAVTDSPAAAASPAMLAGGAAAC